MAIFIKGGPGGGSGVALDGDYADPDQLGSGKSGTAPGQAKQRLAADQTWSEPLEHFAESWDETYKVAALTGREDPDDAEATVDIALVPKGSGGIQAAITDATAAGGNARGTYSVDMQTFRSNATMVASGDFSVVGGGASNRSSGQGAVTSGGLSNISSNTYSAVGGGASNTASGTYSTVGGGQSNTSTATHATVGGGDGNDATDVYATIAGGRNNTASQDYATVAGGNNNTASQTYASVGGGTGNTASGNSSTVVGGDGNTASGPWSTVAGATNTASASYSTALGTYSSANMYGQTAVANGPFAAVGDAQQSWLTARRQTTDGTANVELFLDASSQRIVLPNDTTWMFTVRIVARRTDANDESAAYELKGCIDRNATAATTALVGSVTKTVIAEDTAAWDVQATADTTNGSLKLDVTGEAGKTIRWVASIHLVQVTG